MLPYPEEYIRKVESRGNITIGMTNLPSHFEMGYPYTQSLRHVRLALGFHPLLIGDNQQELKKFVALLDKTSYIGEIGLDFSKEGYATKDIQVSVLHAILHSLQGKKKIISVHSRGAELALFNLLKKYHIENVIFHWYSGRTSLIHDILKQGYYFSVNESMTLSSSGQKILCSIPKDRILTETDAPFNTKTSIKNVLAYMNMTSNDIHSNFMNLLQNRVDR